MSDKARIRMVGVHQNQLLRRQDRHCAQNPGLLLTVAQMGIEMGISRSLRGRPSRLQSLQEPARGALTQARVNRLRYPHGDRFLQRYQLADRQINPAERRRLNRPLLRLRLGQRLGLLRRQMTQILAG